MATAKVWKDLAGDARTAFAARGLLAQLSDIALPLLREHLQPAPPTDLAQLQKWIADLDNERFTLRQQAQRRIEELGEPARGGATAGVGQEAVAGNAAAA
jgi:hypothetical protein